MPEYLAPGVYVEEIDSGPPPIQGVGTSTTAFVGMTRRGPIEGRPVLVTNYGEFVRTFGGGFDFGPTFAQFTDLPHAARGFFTNGGRRLYVMRVAPATATAGTHTFAGGLVTHLVRDAPATTTVVTLPTLRGIRNGTAVQLRMIRDGITTDSAVLTVSSFDRTNGEVTLNAAPSASVDFEARYTTVFTNIGGLSGTGQITNLATPTTAKPATFGAIATNPGSWAHDVRISVSHRSAARSIVQHTLITAPTNAIPVQSTAGFYPGAWIEVDFGNAANQKIYRHVTAVTNTTLVIDGAAVNAGAWDPVAPVTETRVSSCEFDLVATYTDPVERTVVNESFTGLTLEDVPGRHYIAQLERSQLLRVDPAVAAPAALHPFFFPSPTDGFADTLDGAGVDGTLAPTVAEIQGTDLGPNRKTGLLSIEDVDEVAILAAPGITDIGAQRALIDQCERLMDRFAVLDPVPGTSGAPATLDQIQAHAGNFDTKYAALYYPRVIVADAVTGVPRVVAPSGHMAGIYARVDNTRGVHKAPANEVIRGITDLEVFVSKAQQEILNPRSINVLRDFRTDRRGLRAYGARCLTSDAAWKYINVRRLFIFLEESIDEGTQYAVFEPNDERLWARIRDSVSIFLTGVWRDGALMGEKPEDAFFVVCDRNTMSDDDILNGRLVMEIGIAPVRPAEFVIIRIGQWLGGSSTQEL
jgi:phage tail sheath protein FI